MGSIDPRSGDFTFDFEGREIAAWEGDSIAAALARAGIVAYGTGKDGAPRGPFCGMGVCHDCLVSLPGQPMVRACMTKAVPGMAVHGQHAKVAFQSAPVAPPALATLPERAVDVLVVGAGPGGLAAACAAAASGCSVQVTDERSQAGGQYFKQPANRSRRSAGQDAQGQEGAALIARAQSLGVAVHAATMVWGGQRENDGALRIGLHGPGGVEYIRPRVLIIATGAYEQPPIFPGWTLPGVMTTGAAQTLLRSYGVAPGRRVLVCGNGPLNLQVALELAEAGTDVVGVAELAPSPRSRPVDGLKLLAASPGLAMAGATQLRRLKARGVPVWWAHRLLSATGQGRRVTAATIADSNGRQRQIAVDAICINEGFAPSNELARLLGCTHAVKREGFPRLEVQRDDSGLTSAPDVFVVGEAGGFGGAHIAMAQGELSGAAAAKALGKAVAVDGGASARLKRHRAFQKALWRLFAPDFADAPERADGQTLVCRCECVSLDALKHTKAGDIATLKRLTRAGMGRCQSRYCAPGLMQMLGTPSNEAGFLAPQMPLRPIPLAALAVEKPEWGGHKRAMLPPAPAPHSGDPLGIDQADVVVIGGGVVGAATALFLARGGADVVVLERGFINARASGGNAGSLHAQLLSFDHGAKAEGGGSPAARTLPLQRDSIALWQQLERETGGDFEIKVTGGLMVAETERDLRFLEEKCRVERAFGIDCSVIDALALRSMEPALDARFVGAAYCPQEGKINPLVATQGLVDAAKAAGARFFTETDVIAVERTASGFIVSTARGAIRARRVVNAAGAFASEIGNMVGRKVPVFGAPLQMIVTEAAEPTISCLIAHADRHLTLKQAANGNFIIGGGWTAGLDPVHRHPRPSFASLEGNAWVAQHVVPALRQLNVIRTWAAMNINIDGAPILGEDPGLPGFFNAVTSNGYTLGPLVGRITADIILRGRTERDVSAFSLARFDQPTQGTAA